MYVIIKEFNINKNIIKLIFIESININKLNHLKNINIKGGRLAKLKNMNKVIKDKFIELNSFKKKFNLNKLIIFIIIIRINLYDKK